MTELEMLIQHTCLDPGHLSGQLFARQGVGEHHKACGVSADALTETVHCF